VRGAVEALLEGLADGSLDPADPAVRCRCAIEASRMRRFFAESDEVSHPLVHELYACADVAERRGVQVELAVLAPPPPLAPEIRRALTEPVICGLATAVGRARVTVDATRTGVSVCLVAQSAGQPEHRHDDVLIASQPDGDRFWTEARWTCP
jgi:hypothetical protein